MAKQPQLEAFSKLLGMLEQAIFNGSTGLPDREFYTVPHPGIFISPNLTDRPGSDDMALIARLFNGCFDSTLLYSPQLSTVNQTYEDLLTQAALPEKELTKDEEKTLERLEKQQETLFDSYHKYKRRHDLIQGQIYRAQINKETIDVIYELRQKLDEAQDEWRLRGKKELYEENEANVAYLRSISPRRLFQNFLERYKSLSSSSPNLGDYQATFLEPPIHEWSSDYAGWSQFSKTFKYSELHTRSSHTSWSGSVGLNFGLFQRVDAGGGGQEVKTYENSENIDIELKFEYLRVRIVRPWLVPDVLLYRFWTYKKAFGFRQISSGFTPGNKEPVGPKGLMPVLPTDIILAKNVTISAAFTESEKTFVRKTLSGSVSGGWGPFSARGSYQTTSTKQDVTGSFDETTLRIANPQIIAFMGTLVPKTPDPNRLLPWGDDADFGEQKEEQLFKESQAYVAAMKEQHEILTSEKLWGR